MKSLQTMALAGTNHLDGLGACSEYRKDLNHYYTCDSRNQAFPGTTGKPL